MGNLGTPDNKKIKIPDFMSFRVSINPFGGHKEFLSAPEIPKGFGTVVSYCSAVYHRTFDSTVYRVLAKITTEVTEEIFISKNKNINNNTSNGLKEIWRTNWRLPEKYSHPSRVSAGEPISPGKPVGMVRAVEKKGQIYFKLLLYYEVFQSPQSSSHLN
jgi:hypothetical protein